MSEEKAWSRALNFLSFRARSIQEMRLFLSKNGFEAYSDKIIERLIELSYLDDTEFSRVWINERFSQKSLGKSRLRDELLKKGIDKDIIDQQLHVLLNDSDEYEAALNLAKKRISKLSGIDKLTASRRLSQYIIRSGFPSQVAYKVCQALLAPNTFLDD